MQTTSQRSPLLGHLGQGPIVAPRRAVASTGAAPRREPLTADQAIVVHSVSEEYAWMRANLRPGWQRVMQSLVPHGEHTFDVQRVRLVDGSERDYWFDVTSIMGRLAAAFPVPPGGDISVELRNGQLKINGVPAQDGATCRRPCALPSSDSACDLMNGDLNALPRVLFHCAGRSLLIGIGIFAAGERDLRRALQGGVGAAVVIELFALVWAGLHRDNQQIVA